MSGGLDVLALKEEDMLKFLAAGVHLGSTNVDFQMAQYTYKRKPDGCSAKIQGVRADLEFQEAWENPGILFHALKSLENRYT
ncbi:40S ribosomal protein sa [Plakobranchus ocellatus]|uniref:40S ribosomal protein sa n=1 Tax=Plakobranchus ocellatus TaxID=259542 RepID=A0AAV3ZYR1_9GAST|nr:40S ribosomal protein sa [Plakobranchus ocellatus]